MRILFFGNQDNLGYELCKWCRESGVEGEVYSFEHEIPRCQPELIDPELSRGYPDWFHLFDAAGPMRYFPMPSRQLIREAEQRFDVLVASGTRGLLASRAIRLPKVLYAIGGDVAEAPFPFAARWQGIPAALYRIFRVPFARAAIRDMDAIIENYHVNLKALERLNLLDRRICLGIPEDAIGNRRKLRPEFLTDLQARYKGHRRVFLWLTRLNFLDPQDAAYKGADRFLAALDSVRAEIESGAVKLVIGTHGHDVDAFRQRSREMGFEPLIDWVPHLPYIDMLSYLALPNAVVFGKFGEQLAMPAAIDRDAFTMGSVLVSTVGKAYAAEIYGAEPPVLDAVTTPEIARRMREVVDMDDQAFQDLQRHMRDYGERYIDYRPIIRRFLALLEQTVSRSKVRERTAAAG